MATTTNTLTILENCRILPPPTTVGEKSLELTFFDFQWLTFPPVQQLFFYDFPHPKTRFTESIVPNLKHSLSIALQYFFPFTSNLIVFSPQNQSDLVKNPQIRHVDGDFLALTFAESTLDFSDLTGNHPRNCDKFYQLIPSLGPSTKKFDYMKIPLFSVQVTNFPNLGFSIGITNHHVLCDARTKFDFLKTWTSIARSRSDDPFLANISLPFYDRVIKYPSFLDEIFLSLAGVDTLNEGYQPPRLIGPTDNVRATFVLNQTTTARFKKWISTHLPTLNYISSFSVACAYIWSCIAKSRAECGEKKGEDELEKFIVAVDCRARLDPPIPSTYFGNCVAPCIIIMKSTVLSGNDGFLKAAELLGNEITKMVTDKGGICKEAHIWIKKALSDLPTTGVAGTPKLNVYDIDFGWGKPKKCETISIDYNGSISMNACKGSKEDLEISLSLNAKQMDIFATIFKNELDNYTFLD